MELSSQAHKEAVTQGRLSGWQVLQQINTAAYSSTLQEEFHLLGWLKKIKQNKTKNLHQKTSSIVLGHFQSSDATTSVADRLA